MMVDLGCPFPRVSSGGHGQDRGFGCGQECLRKALGLPWSDERIEDGPDAQCPVLHQLVIEASDDPRTTDAERADGGLLWRLTVATVGTDDRAATERRAFRCADWAVREVAPVALEARGLKAEAAKLRALPPVVDRATAKAAAHLASASASAVASASAAAYLAASAASAAASAAARASAAGHLFYDAAADAAVYASIAAGHHSNAAGHSNASTTTAARDAAAPRPIDLLQELVEGTR